MTPDERMELVADLRRTLHLSRMSRSSEEVIALHEDVERKVADALEAGLEDTARVAELERENARLQECARAAVWAEKGLKDDIAAERKVSAARVERVRAALEYQEKRGTGDHWCCFWGNEVCAAIRSALDGPVAGDQPEQPTGFAAMRGDAADIERVDLLEELMRQSAERGECVILDGRNGEAVIHWWPETASDEVPMDVSFSGSGLRAALDKAKEGERDG